MTGRSKALIALAVCLFAVLGVGILVARQATSPTPPGETSLPAAPPSRTSAHLEGGPHGTWRRAVTDYASALTPESGDTLDTWLHQLRPVLTPALLRSYRDTDLAHLPRGAPTSLRPLAPAGKPQDARGPDAPVPARVRFGDGVTIDVVVAVVDGRWRVVTAGEYLSDRHGAL
jgi:hypothetical protein